MKLCFSRAFALFCLAASTLPARAADERVPLIASFDFEATTGNRAFGAVNLPDANGTLEGGAQFGAGHAGRGLALNGKAETRAVADNLGLLNRLGKTFTVSVWVKLNALPKPGEKLAIMSKRSAGWHATPFILGVDGEGRVVTEGNDGLDWSANFGSEPNAVKAGEWTHIAFSWRAGGEGVQFANGRVVGRKAAVRGLSPNDEPLVFGHDEYSRAPLDGIVDDARLYAVALTPEQVALDRGNKLETRPATQADFAPPTQVLRMHLTRFDQPEPRRNLRDGDFDAVSRKLAQRKPGPDAIDWPQITLDGAPLWAKEARDFAELPLREGDAMKPLFRLPNDQAIQPGNHWLRALNWFWNQKHVYTTDISAHGFGASYELMTFPVVLRGIGETGVKNVSLRYNNREIYTRAEPLRSLTLLLPANETGKPYELRVDGQSTKLNVGLLPILPGAPDELARAINLKLPNGVTVRNDLPTESAYQSDWDADLKAMMGGAVAAPLPEAATSPAWWQRVGVEVPRSGITINGEALRAGMSSGWMFDSPHVPGFAGSVDEYAKFLASQGFDRVWEYNGGLDSPDDPKSFERLLVALNAQGVGGGIMLRDVHHANIAFFSESLPEYKRPTIRDFQVAMGRLKRYPNFVGTVQGADNGGYVSYWDWAGPIMNRPWGRAFETFQNGRPLKAPLGPALTPNKDYEVRATQREFVDYIRRYDQTFHNYGVYARAVREVSPRLTWTTGSFGSSPGVGSRGGWPFATVPAREMFRDVETMQAYDWNETPQSKPLHNLALIDRMRSQYPAKTAWTVVDDFGLFFSRQARQRAWALAMTRGVSGIGTNFLAHAGAKPEAVQDYRDLFAFAHKYGGAFALNKPLAPIGILYVHEQATSRMIVGEDNDSPRVYDGSHEGKVTEALNLCHLAGWPARVVTPDELKRGLPSDTKALLLVGLNRFDKTWNWSDGLEPALNAFAKRGGRVLRDDESVCPVASTETGMRVAAYIRQDDSDAMPIILARNADNLVKLRAVMDGVAAPIATSGEPTIWAVPSVAGDVQYVTVANWAWNDPKTSSREVKPQTGDITWNTTRPIYDLQNSALLTSANARRVDLTRDGARVFALPPAKVSAPQVALRSDADGRYVAAVSMQGAKVGSAMRGVPVELTISDGAHSATVYTATGQSALLPMSRSDAGRFTLTAKELLSGQTRTQNVPRMTFAKTLTPTERENRDKLSGFALRKNVPLVVALTPEQQKVAPMRALASGVAAFYRKQGRRVEVRSIKPGDVVLSLQPGRSQSQFPQWRTIDADLVLLGTPSDNLLLFDQARGYLLPNANAGVAWISMSPFVGERHVLNLLGSNQAQLNRAAAKAMSAP